MPYKSEAQRKYFNANRKKLEAEGVDVDHWNKESKGKAMPEKKSYAVVQNLAWAIAQQEKAANLKSPYVREKLENEEEEEKPQRNYLAAGLLGVGGASALGLSRGIANDETANTLREIPNLKFDAASLPKNETANTLYNYYMSAASGAKPFGLRGGRIAMDSRTNPSLLMSAGQDANEHAFVDRKPREYANAYGHYDQYGRGPIPAYWHDMMTANIPENKLTPEFRDYLAAKNELPLKAVPEKYTEWVVPEFRKFLKETLPVKKDSNKDKPVLPSDISTEFMSAKEQGELLRNFMASLSPEEQKMRQLIETEQTGPFKAKYVKSYGKSLRDIVNTREGLQTAGMAGLGGGVGYGLGQLLEKVVDDDDDPDNDPWYRRNISTGLGIAGAGAGALSTDGGKRLLDKLKKLAGKTKKANYFTTQNYNSGIKQAGIVDMDVVRLAQQAALRELEKEAGGPWYLQVGKFLKDRAKNAWRPRALKAGPYKPSLQAGRSGKIENRVNQIGQPAVGFGAGYGSADTFDPDASFEQKMVAGLGGGLLASPAFRQAARTRGLHNYHIKPRQAAKDVGAAMPDNLLSPTGAENLGMAQSMATTVAGKGGAYLGLGIGQNAYEGSSQIVQQPKTWQVTDPDTGKTIFLNEQEKDMLSDLIDTSEPAQSKNREDQQKLESSRKVQEAKDLYEQGNSIWRSKSGITALNEGAGKYNDAVGQYAGEESPVNKAVEKLEPISDLAETVNVGIRAAGKNINNFGKWVSENSTKLGLGALGAAGVYGLYKVMRRKAEKQEEEEQKQRRDRVYQLPKSAADYGSLAAQAQKQADALQESMKIAPHTAIFGGTVGAGLGGVHGLLKDPGYDKETGERKSRLLAALEGAGKGAAIGGVGMGLVPPASVLATRGYKKILSPLHELIAKAQGEELNQDPPAVPSS